jgi:uncharacterized membrane protein YhaH (DUF805 family)
MAASSRVVPFRRFWFVGLSLLAFALVLAAGALLWQAVELTSLATVSERIAGIKPVAGTVRLLFIGLLAIFWPRLVYLAARARNADERTRAHWLALRWRVTGWLLVIELVLDHNLLGRFLSAVSGAAV